MLILIDLFLFLFLIVFANAIPTIIKYSCESIDTTKTSRGYYSYFEPRFKVDRHH